MYFSLNKIHIELKIIQYKQQIETCLTFYLPPHKYKTFEQHSGSSNF